MSQSKHDTFSQLRINGDKRMTHMIAGMAAGKVGNMLGFGKRPNYEAMPEDLARKEYNKRTRRKVISMLGATSLVLGGVMGFNGYLRGQERNPPVETESSANDGEASIVKFNANYESHCWTATTLQVNGSGVKDEVKALGIAVADKWTKTDFQTNNNVCVGDTEIGFAVDAKTGHTDMNLRKEDLYVNTSIVYGSIKTSSDQSLSYAFADNTINMMESLPIIEDTGLSKDASKAQDAQNAHAVNTALLLGSAMANEKCMDQTLPLAKKPLEEGIKRLASLGLSIAQVKHKDIDPSDISVLVDGKPISELDSLSDRSNIHDAYEKLKKFDAENENFSILPPSDAACEPSQEVKNQLNELKSPAAQAAGGKG